MDKEFVKISKYLSLVLRHRPERIGITLDANGWAEVETLLALINERGMNLTRSKLETVVAENDKQRFAFSEDGTKIRANQGHSIEIDLALEAQTPPETLFHGTAEHFVDSIRHKGLISGKRQHVHLSLDRETAEVVGGRHGKVAVLIVNSGEMQRSGGNFYLSANGVWLTEFVPAGFIVFPE